MAEENQIENTEPETTATQDDPQSSRDAAVEEAQDDNALENITETQAEAVKISSKKKKKWFLLPVILLLISIIAVGVYKFRPEWFERSKIDYSSINSVNIEEDNLIEKELSPFFIPPSQGINSSMIRIDLSVIWDGLAAVRFQNRELQIRNDIYKYISKLTEKTKDLNSEVSYIEAEMSNIFREALGVNNLVIMIREINRFQ